MVKRVQFKGKEYQFADTTPEDEIASLLEDVDRGATWAETVRYIPGAIKRSLAKTVAGAVMAGKELVGADAEQERKTIRTIEEEAREEMPVGGFNILQEAAITGAESLVYAAPALVAAPLGGVALAARGVPAAATRVASAAATGISIPTGFQTYAETRMADIPPLRAAGHAMFDALVEKYTEQVPLRVLSEAGGKGLWNTVKRFVGREMAGEQVATLLQDINAKLSYRPDMTLGDYMRDAAVTALAVGGTGPVQAGLGYAVASALPSPTTPPSVPPTDPATLPPSPTPASGATLSPVPAPTPSVSMGRDVSSLLARAPATIATAAAPTTNVVDLTQIARETRPTPQGMMRLYYAEELGADRTALPSHAIFTTSLEDVQNALNAAEGRMRVLYTNATPAELQQAQERAPEEIKRQITKAGIEFPLSSLHVEHGFTLYEPGKPRPQTPITTGQPIAPAATTPQTQGVEQEGTEGGLAGAGARAPSPERAERVVEQPPQLRIRRGGAGDVRVEFPDVTERILFEAGALLKKKGKVAQAEEMLRVVALERGLPLSVIRGAAQEYRDRVLAEVKRQPAGAQYAAPQVEGLERPQVGQVDEFEGQGVPGIVTIAKGVEIDNHILRIQALMQKWVKIFAPTMKMVIVGQAQRGFLGSITPTRDGTMKLRTPPQDRGAFVAAMNLSHEFGHALVFHYLYRPEYQSRLSQLRAEHQSIVARVPNMTAEQFVREWGGLQSTRDIRNTLQRFQVAPDAPAQEYIDQRDALHALNYLEAYGPVAYLALKQQMGQSYTLSFDEYAAEQVSRYIGRNFRGLIDDERGGFVGWARELVETLKEYFDKVFSKLQNAPKFNEWLEELRSGGPMSLAAPLTQLPAIPTAFQELDTDKRMQYTTRVLSRLPDKAMVKKITIYAEMGRQDVRAQEKELLQKVMATFAGDSVPRDEFKRAVLSELVPLTMSRSIQYADYGLSRIGIQTRVGPRVPQALTHIWQVPYEVDPRSNHFGDNHYFGHTRVFWERATIGARQVAIPFYNIVEIQSDVVQRRRGMTPQEREGFERRLARYESVISELIAASGDRNIDRLRELYIEHEDLGTRRHIRDPGQLEAWAGGAIHELTLRATEIRTALAASQTEWQSALPKNWWELLIREEVRNAANMGVQRVRVASADTVAKVEGWTESLVAREGLRLGKTVREVILEETRFIYDRYANEIPKFLRREFDATQTADYRGNTWWEFEVKPDTKGLPLEYFELDQANESAADRIATEISHPDDPEAPAAIRAFPRFMFAILQLNQIAKLLPEVPGLQKFRRLMQAVANVKNQLMAGPNDRIKEWYRLSRQQSRLVEQFLRDEVNNQSHITSLQQTLVTINGEERVMWQHLPSENFGIEVRRRGLNEDAAKLILGVKNDFLLTLDVMERTVLNSIAKYFRNNPMASRIRQQEVAREFQKLRETPYLPDRRFGKWGVQIRAKRAYNVDGKEIKKNELVYWSKHESKWSRDRELKRLSAQYGREFEVVAHYAEDQIYVLRGLPKDFVQAVREQLNITDPTMVEKLEQIQYDFTKEGAFFKLLGKGKKFIGGADTNIRRVYADYHWRTANMIAKMLHGDDLRAALREVQSQADAAAKAGSTSNLLDMLHERLTSTLDYVMRPQHEWEQLRAWVSLWYLWGVPKTAFMNLMSIPVHGYSYLQARYGVASTTAQLLRTMKDVVQYHSDPNHLSQDEQALLQRAKEDGVTDQSFAAELASVSDATTMERMLPQWQWFQESGAQDAIKKAVWRTVDLGMLPFRAVEQYNRQVMLLTTYRLAVQSGMAKITSGNPTSYLAARDAVDYTQNEYNPWNRPAFMQGKQSIFLIFYSFMQNSLFLALGGDKGWWRMWLILFGLAGLQGLPLVDDMIDILNGVWKKLSGEHIDIRKEARQFAQLIGVSPDWLMHGAMHNMFGLGWDSSYSIGFGRAIPGLESAFQEGDFDSNFVRFLADAGGPFGSLTIGTLKALHDDNPQQLLRWEKIAPTAIRNVIRAGRMAAEGEMTDGLGRTLVDSPSELEMVGQALGFTPTRKATMQEQTAMQRDHMAFYAIKRENLMAMWHQAKRAQDDGALEDVRAAIDKYNESVPYFELRITGRSLAISSRKRRQSEDALERGRSPIKRYRRLYGEIDELFEEETVE